MNKKESQAVLLAHYKSPIGMGGIHERHLVGKGINPLCGDEISVGVTLQSDMITDVKFQARACSICIASASIMSQLLINEKAYLLHYNTIAMYY
jgi:nitrogen fixation NifU-like protein